MDADPADELAVLQADVLPAAPGIGRLVDAVAVGDVDADRRLAGAGVDHVGIGGRDGDRADRRAAHEAVGDAAPVHAAVVGLPDAAGAGAEVEHHLVDGIAGDGDDAAATRGTDAAPLERVETRRRGQALFRCHVREGRSLQVTTSATVSQVRRARQSTLTGPRRAASNRAAPIEDGQWPTRCRPRPASPTPASARSTGWRTAGRPGSTSRPRSPARRPSSASFPPRPPRRSPRRRSSS